MGAASQVGDRVRSRWMRSCLAAVILAALPARAAVYYVTVAGLGGEPESEVPGPHRSDWDDELRTAAACYRWPTVEVLIVPSGQPDRRVNTEDQLRYWASRHEIGRDDRVLLLTTQIYVPFQQLVALRVLGIERGCAVRCCGVDAKSSFLPGLSFSGRSYLQEIRSALLAADTLMTAARDASG